MAEMICTHKRRVNLRNEKNYASLKEIIDMINKVLDKEQESKITVFLNELHIYQRTSTITETMHLLIPNEH